MKFQILFYDSLLGWYWLDDDSHNKYKDASRSLDNAIKSSDDLNAVIINKHLQVLKQHGTVPALVV